MDIVICQAVPEDLEALARIEAACFPPAEAASPASLKERLELFADSFFVAKAGGIPIGFVNGCVTDEKTIRDEMFEDASLHRPDGAYQAVFGLDVLPDHQHQGVATQLMNHLIATARRRGKRGVILTCKEGLIPFYSRFGFRNDGISASIHGGAVWYDMTLTF